MCAAETRYATGMPKSDRPLRRRAIYQVRFWQHLRYVACLEVSRHASHRHTIIRMKTKVLLLVDFIDKLAMPMRLLLHAQPQRITESGWIAMIGGDSITMIGSDWITVIGSDKCV